MRELFSKIGQDKKERVIEAAICEFAEHGYENANTNTIAKRAHISIGSLFQYFESKEDLFMFIVSHCAQMLVDAFKDVVLQSDPFFVTVEKILRRLIRESYDNPNYVKLYFEMTSSSKSYLQKQIVSKMEGYSCKLYRSIFIKGQRDGFVRGDCDIRLFSFMMDNLFMMFQYSYSCGYYKERFKIYGGEDVLEQDERIIGQFMKFIKGALSA